MSHRLPRSRKAPSWPRIKSRVLPSGNTTYKIDVGRGAQREFHTFQTEAEADAHAWQMHNLRQAEGRAGFDLRVVSDAMGS